MTRKLVLFLAVLAVALPSAVASADLPRGFVGVSPQSAAKASDFELMRDAGVSSVRLPLYWHGVQAKSPFFADPHWANFDREVEIAAREDIRIFPFVWGSPEWVAPETIEMPVRTPFQRWAWADFLRAAAERYGPSGEFWAENPELTYLPIRRWEIWNEENLVTWAKDPSPARYAALLRISGKALRRVDLGAELIVGGFFGRPLQIPPNLAPGDYLTRLYRARGVKRWFDGVGLHPYVADAAAIRGQMRTLRRVMRANGDAGTPVYLTELGWGSRSGPTRWEVGLAGQARQLQRSFAMISANRERWRIGGLWWFTWSDEGGTCQFCGSAGLLTADRRAKPAWYRFNEWTGGDSSVVARAAAEGPAAAGG